MNKRGSGRRSLEGMMKGADHVKGNFLSCELERWETVEPRPLNSIYTFSQTRDGARLAQEAICNKTRDVIGVQVIGCRPHGCLTSLCRLNFLDRRLRPQTPQRLNS
jgi:hypothetical protein